VAHAYNPSYSEGRDGEDCSLKPARVKKFLRPHLNEEQGAVVHSYYPS
jgi:hypothetical protein